MSEPEFIEEPRSWPRFIVDALRTHAAAFYALGAVFFALIALVGVAMVIHINWADIGWLTTIEQRRGAAFEESGSVLTLYLNLTLVLAGLAASLDGLVSKLRD